MEQAGGRVVQIQGGVVDVVFPDGELPFIYECLEVLVPDAPVLMLEVQKQTGKDLVRCVAMDTDGLAAAQHACPADQQPHPGAGRARRHWGGFLTCWADDRRQRRAWRQRVLSHPPPGAQIR